MLLQRNSRIECSPKREQEVDSECELLTLGQAPMTFLLHQFFLRLILTHPPLCVSRVRESTREKSCEEIKERWVLNEALMMVNGAWMMVNGAWIWWMKVKAPPAVYSTWNQSPHFICPVCLTNRFRTFSTSNRKVGAHERSCRHIDSHLCIPPRRKGVRRTRSGVELVVLKCSTSMSDGSVAQNFDLEVDSMVQLQS